MASPAHRDLSLDQLAHVVACLLCDHVDKMRGLPVDRFRLLLAEARTYLCSAIDQAELLQRGSSRPGDARLHGLRAGAMRRRLWAVDSELTAIAPVPGAAPVVGPEA